MTLKDINEDFVWIILYRNCDIQKRKQKKKMSDKKKNQKVGEVIS
jgi:hypothetical protein